MKEKKTAYIPNKGYAWNPAITKIGRNELCPCGSENKFKKCCLQTQPRCIPEKDAKQIAVALKTRRRT